MDKDVKYYLSQGWFNKQDGNLSLSLRSQFDNNHWKYKPHKFETEMGMFKN